MAAIRKAHSDDFERVTPLLLKYFHNPTLGIEDYWKIFIPRWGSQEDYYGCLLEEDDRVVGFLGALFSTRPTPLGAQKFANLTCWVVEPEFRSESLLLLMHFMRLKDTTITNFTGNKVAGILRKFGFTDLDSHYRLALPLPTPVRLWSRCSMETEPAAIAPSLEGDARRVLDDHGSLRCGHLLLASPWGKCYMVFDKVKKKGMPVVQIHYISDLDVFMRLLPVMSMEICTRLGGMGIMAGEHLLRGRKLTMPSLRIPQGHHKLFRSPVLGRYQMDTIYSELQLFGLTN